MLTRNAASVIAAFVFIVLAFLSVGTNGSRAQHIPSSAVLAGSSDKQRRNQLQFSSVKITASDATAMTELAAPPATHHSAQTEPFGLTTITAPADPLVTMWNIMEHRIRADREVLMRCHETPEACSAAAKSFLAIVAEGREHTGRARIGVINRAINLTIQAASMDRWTAPLETIAIGRGDCKQYAIAKYFALIEAGISENDVKLVIVHDLGLGQNHAIVVVGLKNKWIVLDNRWLTMVEDTDFRGTVPLFLFDRYGVRQFRTGAI